MVEIRTLGYQEKQTIVVDTHGSRWRFINIQELWQFRRLLQLLLKRDISARYKQTIAGILWTIINPLIMMLVFNFVFADLAGIQSYNIPYPIFNFSGLVIWGFFSRGFSLASVGIISESGLLKKIYFPRIILPISKIMTGFVDFVMSFIVLIVMMIVTSLISDYKIQLGPRIFLLPLFTILALITTLGLSLWFSAVHVRYRDIGQIVPFLVQIIFMISPVTYPSSLVSGPMQYIYAFNPMVAVLDGYRWSLLGIESLNLPYLVISSLTAFTLLISGIFVFNRLEQTFTDYL